MNKFPGGHRGRVTPVPIPNTEVKPATADGTACVGVWESRSLPGLIVEDKAVASSQRPFLCLPHATACRTDLVSGHSGRGCRQVRLARGVPRGDPYRPLDNTFSYITSRAVND